MKNMNIDKEWDFIISEVHREKPNKGNLLKRELLFTIQNLLCLMSMPKLKVELEFLKEVYIKTKKQYLKF